jgi:type I restriction enzyme R subunit
LEHGVDPASPNWKQDLNSNSEIEDQFHRLFTRQFMAYLDRGYGACVLRDPKIARMVSHSLNHFDGDRYTLGDYVVMPNHVHLLVCLHGTTEIQSQCESWKKFTAGKINQAIGKKGRFWQEESFDHLVRKPEQFAALKRYIADNPRTANLRPGEFLHWRRSDLPK